MIRISHRELENARNDPTAFMRLPRTQIGFGPSAFRLWQYAVRVLHRPGNSLKEAIAYLEGSYEEAFKPGPSRDRRFHQFREYLGDYSADFSRLGHSVVELGRRTFLNLGYDVYVTGEIGRIDLTSAGGYAAYIFAVDSIRWRNELRMPLLQSYLATELGVHTSLIQIGMYILTSGKHDSVSFPPTRISRALKEADALARNIASLAASRHRRSRTP